MPSVGMLALIVGAIALKEVNVEWLREVKTRFRTVLIMQDPADDGYKAADSYVVTRDPLGFGGARRMSMLLAAELDTLCLVTDGDGQHGMDALAAVAGRLDAGAVDVVIPNRVNRKLFVEYKGRVLDRTEFEKFEGYCALEAAGSYAKGLSHLDAQPGLFGFRSDVVERLLPKDRGWLADWEIALNALKLRHAFVDIKIRVAAEEKTTYNMDGQMRKLEAMQGRISVPLKRVYEEHSDEFHGVEKAVLEEMLDRIARP